jgi:pyruvate/2-oxoacid:ferredoxin oxidoreductase alpha subunit
VIVTIGSITGTARVVVDAYRDQGVKVGLIKVRSFRPFPRERILQAIRGKKAVGVIDRAVEFGWGRGHLWIDMKATMSDLPAPVPMPGFLDGLGGMDPSKSNITRAVAITEAASRGLPYQEVTWMGLEKE